MKKTVIYLATSSLILSLGFSSCVSNKKYEASEARAYELQKEKANTLSQLNDCNAQVKNLNIEMENLKTENTSVQKDLKVLASESKMTIADQAEQLRELKALVQSQRDVMTNLKNSISDALINYKADELTVYIKDGNVYVSLAEKLLFKSGSDMVNPKGKEALKSLATVISNTKDITVLIEGHTDNVPINTSQFEDNWDLSAARATSIVRILTKDYGVDPVRITAAGRSEFHPVAANETPEGCAGNRRTEIILSPDLKELYELLNQ